jgi:hypothetical protein
MTYPINLGLYGDVKTVLDSAVERGGIRVEFSDHRAAIAWRHRASYFRTLLYKNALKLALPGQTAFTAYDGFVFRVSENVVEIVPRVMAGKMTDLLGNPLDNAPQVANTEGDNLRHKADEAKRALMLEINKDES